MTGLGPGEASLYEGREPPTPRGVEAYAHIEGLVGQEAALLEVPEDKRSQEQHERLRAIREELDRVWERLRERAERRGHKS